MARNKCYICCGNFVVRYQKGVVICLLYAKQRDQRRNDYLGLSISLRHSPTHTHTHTQPQVVS